jgi:hypothetical protein
MASTRNFQGPFQTYLRDRVKKVAKMHFGARQLKSVGKIKLRCNIPVTLSLDFLRYRSLTSFLAASLRSPLGFQSSGNAALIMAPTCSGSGRDVLWRKYRVNSRAQSFISGFPGV